jgi:hypothetical protein
MGCWAAVVLFVLLLGCEGQAPLGCRNMQGQLVEWFAIITTPLTVHKKDPGNGFLYLDSSWKNDSFNIY